MRVLHLDDEPDFLDIAKSFLEGGGGIEVDVETDAARALEMLSRNRYDVIVSDYLMPGMDGIAFLKEVRKGKDRIPFVLFTGRGREQVAMEALNLGADFYLQKGGDVVAQFGELRNVILQLAQRRTTEERLVESERKYRDLVENANSVIVKLDWEGRITFINTYAMSFYNCTESVIGSNVIGTLLNPDLYTKEELEGLVETFSPDRRSPSGYTFPVRRGDGTVSWLAITSRTVRDDSGRPAETLLIGSDVTEAIEAKQMLEELELTHSAMLNGVGEGIVATDRNNKVIFANRRAEELFGGANRDIVGNHVLELLARRDLAAARANLEKRKEGVRGKLEYWLRKADGSEVLAQVIASPIMQDGEFKGTIYAISDITEQKAMEESLRVSEERFRQVTENAGEWIWEVDKEGLYTFSSQAVERMLGYKPDEIVGKMHFYDLFPQDVREKLRDDAANAFRSKMNFKGFKNANVRKDGTIVIFETSGTPILDKDGELLGYRGSDSDVTEREKAEKALRESENRLRRAEEVSLTGHFEIHMDTGMVTGSSGAMAVYGVDTSTWPLSEVEKMTLPEYRSILDKAFDAMIERGEPYNVRYKIRRPKDDQIVDIHSIAEYDKETRTVFGIAHDYTEHARIVEELRESQMKLENAMDIAKLARSEYDTTADMLILNDRFYSILGTTREREGGTRMPPLEFSRRFLPPGEEEVLRSTTEEAIRVLAGGSLSYVKRFEFDIVRRDGERRTLSVIYHGSRDDPAEVTKIYGLVQDVTDLKNIEASLHRANTRLELMNSITRHDIGNQVMVLRGNLKLLKTDIKDPKAARRIERMEGATDDISGRLQLTSGQTSGVEGPVWQNVEELIEGLPVLKDVARLEMGEGIHGLDVLADPMFRIVIHNLLEDSVKYANDPTTVKFNAERKGEDLLLVYEDVGPGISMKDKEKIFERDATRTSGIGMYLCREILSDSEISIKEVGTPGVGVRIEMLVPAGHYRISPSE